MTMVSGRLTCWGRRLWLLILAIAVVLAACTDRSAESLGQDSQALSAVQQRIPGFDAVSSGSGGVSGGGQAGGGSPPSQNDAILGFENPALWSPSSGVSAASDTRVEGSQALQLSGITYSEITSAPLTTLSSVGSVAGFDLSVPSPTGDVWWWGSAAISLDCPSQGIYGRWIGQQELSGATLDRFRRVEVPVPDDVKTVLASGSYSDLRVKIILTVPQGSGPYLLDRFTFAAQVAEPAPPAPSAGVDKILGMETLEGWKTSSGTLALSSNALTGQSSLAVSDFAYADVTSMRVSSLGQPLHDHVTVDLWFPTPPNADWAGSIAASLSIPSKGVYSQWLGMKDVGGLLPNTWNRLSFPIDPGLVANLQADYGDLQVKFSLNRPSQPGAWLLDTADFGQKALELPPPTEDIDIVIPLPRGKSFDQVAVGTALVRRGVFITSPGGSGVIDVPFGDSAWADVAATREPANATVRGHVRDVFSGRDVFASATAHVHGNVFAGRGLELDPGGVVEGTINEGDAANIRESEVGRLHFSFPSTRGAPNIDLESGETLALDPGAYDVASAFPGHLKLRSGSYYFSSLSTSADSTIEIDNNAGPVFVHVVGHLDLVGTTQTSNTSKSNVLFTVRTGQASFVIGKFRGTIVAVDNFALVANDVTGSLFGRDIEAGNVQFVPFKRDDCASQPCGTFGCDAVDTDGDGLFDCQEDNDNDPWTDRLIFNGVHARAYDSNRLAGSCSAIDTLSKVATVTAAQQPTQEQDLYAGWDLPDVPSVGIGCPDSYFWPAWAKCTDIAFNGATATGLAFDYAGFIKLGAGKHCFKVTSAPTVCASMFLNGANEGVNAATGAQCFDLEAGTYPIRWFVDKTKSSMGPGDNDFRLAYCYGNGSTCTPTQAIPQAMLRPDYAAPDTCNSNADCLTGTGCVAGHCQCVDDCQTRACGAVSRCGSVCSILDSACVPDTSTCGTAHVNDGNQCTADTCDAAGQVRHYFRPTGFPCDGGTCDGTGQCRPEGTRGGRGQLPNPDGTCNAGLVVGEDNGGYFDQSAELDMCWDPTCELAAGARCGPLNALCGTCPGSFPPIGTCETNCASKSCGDDPADGCGGTCALCAPGESGCETDADCQLGYQCAVGKGARFGLASAANVCWPEICNSINPQTVPCGATTSACGLCPVCQPVCDGVGCGSDGCGGTCGCASGEYCNSHEECAPVVQLLDGDLPPAFIDPAQYTTTGVGTVAGQFGVSPDGRSTYQVPIAVPPGRGGMQPALSLNYDSGLGDGALGQGWSVKGLSAISLCPKTVAQDGYAHGIASDPEPDSGRDTRPRYCLDGVRLRLVDGHEGRVGGTYLTETDSHQKVVVTEVDASAAPNRKVTEFKLYQPDARIVTFTLTTAPNGWYWLPSRIEDRSGNFMRIEFLQRDVQCTEVNGDTICPEVDMDSMTLEPQVEILPTKVWYAGHDEIDPDTLVEFQYDFRTDGRRGLRSRVWLNQTHLLSTVAVSLGGNPVREYRLEYEHKDAADRTFLTKVRECAPNLNNPADEVCKTPTVFDYDSTAVGLSSSVPLGTHPNNSTEGFYEPFPDLVVDMDNDGVDDLLMAVNDRAPVTPEFFADRHYEILWGGQRRENTGVAVDPLSDARYRAVIDYNADGRDDVLLVPFQDPGNYKVLTHTPQGEFKLIDTHVAAAWADSSGGYDHAMTYVLDVDGDGIRDIVSCQGQVRGVNDSGPWHWRLIHVPDMTVREVNFQGNCFTQYVPISTDGSGAQQLLMQSFYRDSTGALVNKDAYVAISFQNATADDGSGPVTVSTTLTTCPVSENKGTYGIPLDANGDGLTDILVVAPSENRPPQPSQPRHVDIGYQNGIGVCFGAGTTDRADASSQAHPLFVARAGIDLHVGGQNEPWLLGPVMDVNGDGRDDIVVTSSDSTVWQALTLANDTALDGVLNHASLSVVPIPGFAPPALWIAPGPTYTKRGQPQRLLAGRSVAMDVNGDGLPDFVQKTNTTWNSSPLSAFIRTGPRTPLLTSVTDGLGAKTEVAYGQLTAAELPDSDDPLAPFFPLQPIQVDAGDASNCGIDSGLNCRQPRHSVVSLVRTFVGEDPLSPQRQSEHVYSGPRSGFGGRGWLGFSKHAVVEAALEQTTSYDFDNVTRDADSGLFPYANRQVKMVEDTAFLRGDESVRRVATLEEQPDLKRNSKNPAVIFAYNHIITTKVEEQADSAETLSASTDVIEVDGFGNVKSEDLEWRAGNVEHERTGFSYKHEEDTAFEEAWLINLPTNTTHYSQATSLQREFTRERSADYYDNGLLKVSTLEPNKAAYTVQTQYDRDDFGAVQTVTTTGGDETRSASVIERDERKVFPHLVSDAEGYETRLEISSRFGLPVQVTSLGRDGTGAELTQYSVPDGFGRRRVLVEEDGRTANTTYSVGSDGTTGMLVTVDAPGFPTTVAEYDRLGREIDQSSEILAGKSLERHTRYDNSGRVHAVSRPAVSGTLPDPFSQASTFEYDNLGHRVRAFNADGTSKRLCFVGRVSCTEDELHRVTCADHDVRGRVVFVSDPVQGDDGDCDSVAADFKSMSAGERSGLAYQYGPFGFIEQVTRGATILSDARQDQLGRVAKRTDVGLAEKTFSYTHFDKLETLTTAQDTTTWKYDSLDRMRLRTDSVGQSESIWRDDMPGRIDSVQTSGLGQNTRTTDYDGVGRVKSVTRNVDGEDFVVAVESRDDFGHATVVSYPSGDAPFKVKNVYDPGTGLLSEVESVPNDATEDVVSFWKLEELTDFGQPKTETFGGGTATTTRHYFDVTGRPKDITTKVGDASVQDLRYTYFDGGDVETRTDAIASRTESFTYDAFDRLDTIDVDGQQVADPEYTDFGSLQVNGRGWSYAYTPSQPQAVHSIQDGSSQSDFVYTDDGYLKHRSAGPLPELNLEYSSFGKPLREWGADEDAAIRFNYDADEQKVTRTTPSETTVFFDDLYYRVDNADTGIVAHHYLISNGQRVIAEAQRIDGESGTRVRYLHDDTLGSIVGLTNASGVFEAQSFDAFGSTGNSTFTELGYTGQHNEGANGLIDMKGRTYDPQVGQFLQPDPLVAQPLTVEGFNRYSYANNNPLRYVDPSGFDPCDRCPTPAPPSQAPVPLTVPVGGLVIDMTTNEPLGGGTLSSIESGANPTASGRAFSTESSAAGGEGSRADDNMTAVFPPHLIWRGEPLRFFKGTANHFEIAERYTAAVWPQRVFSNTDALSFIVSEMGGDPGLLPRGAIAPDIVNFTTQEIYEIKPLWLVAQGAQDLEMYIQAAGAAGLVLTPGLGGPGTSGVIIYPSGYTIDYGWAAPGLIVYQDAFIPLWVPVRVPERVPEYKLRFQPKFDTTEQVIVGSGAGAAAGIGFWYYAPIIFAM